MFFLSCLIKARMEIYYSLWTYRGVGQFACLFYAMEIGMLCLASIIVQLQAYITICLDVFKGKLETKQLIGFLIAAVGLLL